MRPPHEPSPRVDGCALPRSERFRRAVGRRNGAAAFLAVLARASRQGPYWHFPSGVDHKGHRRSRERKPGRGGTRRAASAHRQLREDPRCRGRLGSEALASRIAEGARAKARGGERELRGFAGNRQRGPPVSSQLREGAIDRGTSAPADERSGRHLERDRERGLALSQRRGRAGLDTDFDPEARGASPAPSRGRRIRRFESRTL